MNGRGMSMKQSRYFDAAVLMDEALLDLLQEKPLEFITVKEVCARACVSRSTFYLHYEGIADLLDESVRLVLDRFLGTFDDDAAESIRSGISQGKKDDLVLVTPSYLRPYLEFVRDNRRLFSALIRNSSAARLEEVYARMEHAIIAPILNRFGIVGGDRRPAIHAMDSSRQA